MAAKSRTGTLSPTRDSELIALTQDLVRRAGRLGAGRRFLGPTVVEGALTLRPAPSDAGDRPDCGPLRSKTRHLPWPEQGAKIPFGLGGRLDRRRSVERRPDMGQAVVTQSRLPPLALASKRVRRRADREGSWSGGSASWRTLSSGPPT